MTTRMTRIAEGLVWHGAEALTEGSCNILPRMAGLCTRVQFSGVSTRVGE